MFTETNETVFSIIKRERNSIKLLSKKKEFRKFYGFKNRFQGTKVFLDVWMKLCPYLVRIEFSF